VSPEAARGVALGLTVSNQENAGHMEIADCGLKIADRRNRRNESGVSSFTDPNSAND
jgi:hypothetical protein